MKKLIAAVILVLSGCATVSTPHGVATSLNVCLEHSTRNGTVYMALACECVENAIARCESAGLPVNCGWNGWNDRDHDSVTINECLRRHTTPEETR